MSDGLSATIGQGSARLPQNFTIPAGTGLILKITVFDEGGEPLPLAGTQGVTWKLARSARSATVVLSKTLDDGVTLIADDAEQGGANAGRLNVQIDPADSADLDGEYFHECTLQDADGGLSRIFYGRGFVAPSIG